MKHRPHGFTLVELLVVVAIIVALLAILMPSMARAIQSAQIAVCGSNLRQAGSTNLLYAADHFGLLWGRPVSQTDQDSSCFYAPGDGYDLRVTLGNYLSDFTIWGCPAVDVPPIDDPANTRAACYGTYWYFPVDQDATPHFGHPGVPTPRRIADAPGRHPMMQDRFEDRSAQASVGGWFINHAQQAASWTWGANNNNPSFINTVSAERSDGLGANVALFDNSVHWRNNGELDYVGDDAATFSRAYSIWVGPID